MSLVPCHSTANRLFKTTWNPDGVRLRGFAHSHPGRGNTPSGGDETYAERILKAIEDLDCLWLPIINTVPETGQFRLTPWVAYLHGQRLDLVRGRIVVASIDGVPSFQVGGED